MSGRLGEKLGAGNCWGNCVLNSIKWKIKSPQQQVTFDTTLITIISCLLKFKAKLWIKFEPRATSPFRDTRQPPLLLPHPPLPPNSPTTNFALPSVKGGKGEFWGISGEILKLIEWAHETNYLTDVFVVWLKEYKKACWRISWRSGLKRGQWKSGGWWGGGGVIAPQKTTINLETNQKYLIFSNILHWFLTNLIRPQMCIHTIFWEYLYHMRCRFCEHSCCGF